MKESSRLVVFNKSPQSAPALPVVTTLTTDDPLLVVSSIPTREQILRMAPLAQRVFEPDDRRAIAAPPRERPSDWFVRKIEREAIVPDLSLLLHTSTNTSPASALGLALLGRD